MRWRRGGARADLEHEGSKSWRGQSGIGLCLQRNSRLRTFRRTSDLQESAVFKRDRGNPEHHVKDDESEQETDGSNRSWKRGRKDIQERDSWPLGPKEAVVHREPFGVGLKLKRAIKRGRR